MTGFVHVNGECWGTHNTTAVYDTEKETDRDYRIVACVHAVHTLTLTSL